MRVQEVLKGFSGGKSLRVNRWFRIKPSRYKDAKLSLHVFTDTSSRAYAAVAYLCVADIKGNVTVNLVRSKCRLSPPDGDTIPRLELLGALLGARFLNSLRSEYNDVLEIDDESPWTDSSVALHGLTRNRVWVECSWLTVWRRLQLLVECGHGLSQNENPADVPTRGMTVVQSSCSKIWWNGPKWLKLPEADWPKHPKNEAGTALLMMALADNEVTEYVEDIVDTPWTSKYHRTLKPVAWKLHWHKSIKSTQPMMTSEEL